MRRALRKRVRATIIEPTAIESGYLKYDRGRRDRRSGVAAAIGSLSLWLYNVRVSNEIHVYESRRGATDR